MTRRPVFDDEHRWFRESAQGFVLRDLAPLVETIRRDHAIPRHLWLRAGEQGLLGLGVSASYGGSGTTDFRFNAVLGEELARVGMAYASSFGIHTDVVAPYLVELTTDAQKERWLPRFCAGELVTAIGLTEPEAGSDLAGLKTSAVRTDGGWRVSGAKTFITNGLSADLVVIAARTSAGTGRPTIGLFAVERDMEGFTRGRRLEKVGQPEADTAELFLDDVLVSDDHVLGDPECGFGYMMERLPQERLSAACANLAHARRAWEITLEYVKDRRAFGRPVGTFQHSRFLMAELSTELDVTQAYVDRCLALHVAAELTGTDAAKAKYWTSEVQSRVLDACVQLHGGYGYMCEYEVARAWTDARVTKIWAGSNEIMKEIIGRQLGLGEPRD